MSQHRPPNPSHLSLSLVALLTMLGVQCVDDETQLPAAIDAVAKGVTAGTALVTVSGGNALTRRLLCEATRLEHRAISLLVEDVEPEKAEDVAVTAVLSGRTDLVAAPNGEAGS